MRRLGLFVERDEGVGAGIDFTDPNSPLARYYLRAGHVLAVAVLAAVFVLLNHVRLWHTDVWGHLKFGERLLDTRQFPAGEPFSPFAERAGVTVNYCWLSQVLFATAYRAGEALGGTDPATRLAGGADASRTLVALLATARFALLVVAFRRRGGSAALAAFGVVFVVLVGAGNIAVTRPQAVAEVLFAALLVILSRPELSRVGLVVVPAVTVLWANTHGSFLIGFLMLGSVTAGRFLQVAWGSPPRLTAAWRDRPLRRLVIVTAVSLAAVSVVNPEGPRIWAATFAMAGHPNVRAMDEWQPITSGVAKGALVTFITCLLVVGIALAVVRGRVGATEWVALLAFGLPTLRHQRALVWFITVAAWVAVTAFGRWRAHRQPPWWSSVPSFRKTLLAATAVVIAVMLSLPAQWAVGGHRPDPGRSLSDGTPWEIAFALEDAALAPGTRLTAALAGQFPDGRFSGTVFASETLGDFFVWRLAPRVPVFIYSHVHLFSADHWKRCAHVRAAGAATDRLLDAYRVNLVVVEAEQNLALCEKLRRDAGWEVAIDEAGDRRKIDRRCRLFAAVRRKPLPALPVSAVQ
jgi:hypothetical protein